MGIIQFSVFLRNTHKNRILKSSSRTLCLLLPLPSWLCPALLRPPLFLAQPPLLEQPPLAPAPYPHLAFLEVLPSSRVSFSAPFLPVARGLLTPKVKKMLLTLSWPMLNPLNATDVSSATWLLVPSLT